jgi:hypothetical protein
MDRRMESKYFKEFQFRHGSIGSQSSAACSFNQPVYPRVDNCIINFISFITEFLPAHRNLVYVSVWCLISFVVFAAHVGIFHYIIMQFCFQNSSSRKASHAGMSCIIAVAFLLSFSSFIQLVFVLLYFRFYVLEGIFLGGCGRRVAGKTNGY